jgi:hypothetical protein
MSPHPHVDQSDGPIAATAKPFNVDTLAKAEVTLGGWHCNSNNEGYYLMSTKKPWTGDFAHGLLHFGTDQIWLSNPVVDTTFGDLPSGPTPSGPS